MYLRPGSRIVPLGEVDARGFMAGDCALPTAIHGVERAGIVLGDVVLVLGTRPVGLSAIALPRMSGEARVLAIGAPDRGPG